MRPRAAWAAAGRRGPLARVPTGQCGQASVELLSVLPYLLVAALLVWQLTLAFYAATSAENAARAASRVEGLGGDGARAARAALSYGLDEGAVTTFDGDQATVRVRVPIVAPGVASDELTVTRRAELPGDEGPWD